MRFLSSCVFFEGGGRLRSGSIFFLGRGTQKIGGGRAGEKIEGRESERSGLGKDIYVYINLKS